MKLSEQFFSPDYFTAKHRFREAAANAGGRLEVIPLEAKGPGDKDLGIDIAWFGPESPRRVVLHSSGLHGVEGFAGSAIQLQFIANLRQLPGDVAIVIVHILNPYGMAWLRRVNENNVDLNRNFLGDEPYSGAPAAYLTLNSFLNPPSPPGPDFYLLKAAYLIIRYGMPALKQSVVGGQYVVSNGLFFGGKRTEEGPRKYQSFLTRRLSAVEKAVIIDVHTGLGKHGEDSLLVETRDWPKLREIYGERVTELQPERGPAYRIAGGLPSMISSVFAKTQSHFLCQEFGTYSASKVLHALREENRWQHCGHGTSDPLTNLNHRTKLNLKRTFCPDDESWRQSVLNRGAELMKQALSTLE